MTLFLAIRNHYGGYRVGVFSSRCTISAAISARPSADTDHDRMLIRRRLLQGRELAAEQGHRHEMLVPRRHAPADVAVRSFEVNQRYVGAIADANVSVGSFQRRASQHAGFAPRAPTVDFLADFFVAKATCLHP
jgi:hypothetical protein